MKALYRRYRPTSLDEVIGQDQVIGPLQKSLEAGKLSHAYLFVGPRGTGKTSVARILAHTINDFKYEIEDNYIDIIEIDGASNRGIDNVRELREKAMVAPSQGKYKIYIIDEVHMFTNEAFNALLKILEEPPQHVIFILATTDAHKVPSTITSRSQIYTFQLSDQKTMTSFLRKVCDAEKIKITDQALDIIYKHGGGSFRDTLSLLDQISTLDTEEITADSIISALGLADQELIEKLLAAYDQQNLEQIQDALKELVRSNTATNTIASALIETIIQNPKPTQFSLLDDLVHLSQATTNYPEVALLVALTKPIATAPIVTRPVAPLQSQTTRTDTITSQPQTTTPKPAASPQPPTSASNSEASEATNDEPAERPQHPAQDTDTKTLWQNILTTAKKKAPIIIKALENSTYSAKDSTFTICCGKDFYRNQIERKRNFILEQLPEDYELIVSGQMPNTSNIDNIKSMMGGGEVVKL